MPSDDDEEIGKKTFNVFLFIGNEPRMKISYSSNFSLIFISTSYRKTTINLAALILFLRYNFSTGYSIQSI